MELPLLQLAFAHLLAAKAGAWALRRARRGGAQQSSTDVAPTGRAPRRAGISASLNSGSGSAASAPGSSKSRPGTKGPRRSARVIATASITAQGPGFSYQAPPEAPAEEPLHAPVPLEWLQPSTSTSASPCPPPSGKALAKRLRPKQPRRSGPAADLAPLPWGSRLARREQQRRATTASDADGSSTDTEARDVVAAPASDPKHWASPARWLPARNLAPTPLAGAAVEPQTPTTASTCPEAATYDWRLGEPWFEALGPSDKDASGEEELQLPGGPSLLTAAMEHIMSRLQSLPPLHPHPLGGPNPLAWLAGAPAPPADANASPTSSSTPSSPSGSPTSAAATPAWPLPGFGGTPAPASAAAAPPTAIQPAEAPPPPQLVATRGGAPAAAAAALSAAGDVLGLNAFAERAVEGPVRGLRELNKTLTANFVDFLSSDSGRRLSEQVAAEMSSGALMAPVYLTEELVKARLKSLVTSHARFLIIFFSLRVVIATAALHATKVALQQVVAHVHTRSPRRRWRWLRASVDYVLDVLLPTGFFGPALGLTAGILQLTGRTGMPLLQLGRGGYSYGYGNGGFGYGGFGYGTGGAGGFGLGVYGAGARRARGGARRKGGAQSGLGGPGAGAGPRLLVGGVGDAAARAVGVWAAASGAGSVAALAALPNGTSLAMLPAAVIVAEPSTPRTPRRAQAAGGTGKEGGSAGLR